jgi:hypothetical protein
MFHTTRAARRATPALAAAAATIAMSAALAAPGAASAASAPFQIGTFPQLSGEIEIPSVDVDSNGTAYVAWPDLTNNKVDYCVLPAGASSCAESGALSPVLEPGAPPQDQPPSPALLGYGHVVEVMVNGGTVSIIADTAGPADEATPSSGGTLPETEMWQAPDGTGNFSLVNNGASVAYPEPRWTYPYEGLTYAELSWIEDGVVVPGSGELGEFDFSGGPPSFEAFPETNPPACSELSQPACPFATLQSPSAPDQVANYGYEISREITSESGQNPGILAVELTHHAAGPFGCSAGDNLSDVYMYGSGLQSATNNYNVSPGQPDSAWKVPATEIPNECPAGPAAIAGGPSGFGLVESSAFTASSSNLDYRPFDSATDAFDKPPVTIDPDTSAVTLGLSQDGSGNIYATGFVQNFPGSNGPDSAATAGAPLALFYSSDGGQTWKGPGPLETSIQPGFSRSESAVGANGTGWIVITAGTSLDAIQFSSGDSANSFAAHFLAPSRVAGGIVTVGMSCYAIPCAVQSTMSSDAAQTSSAKKHPRSSVYGSANLRITKHGVHSVKIRLSAGAIKTLKAKGKLTVFLNESTSIGQGGAFSEHESVRVTLKYHKPKPKHKARKHKRSGS